MRLEEFLKTDYEDDPQQEWKWDMILQLTTAIKHLESPFHTLDEDEWHDCLMEAYGRRADLLGTMPLRRVS